MKINNIKYNLKKVQNKIALFAKQYGRNPDEITLIVVSKNQSKEAIKEAIKAGQQTFGENYAQEAVNKIIYFQQLKDFELKWHFIGFLQSNKSRLIAEHFNWCHTIDRLNIAIRLNEQRPKKMGPLNVLIQINISKEKNKSGINIENLEELAFQVNKLPNLKLRGLMAIPAQETKYEHQFSTAQKMVKAFKILKSSYQTVDKLSLGMSNDMESAIAAGSTMLRIGTAVFGTQNHSKKENI